MMRRIIAGRDSGTACSSTAQPITAISAAPAPVTAANGAKSAAPASVQRTASGSGRSRRTSRAHTTNPAASIRGNPMAKRSALTSTESRNFPITQSYPGRACRGPGLWSARRVRIGVAAAGDIVTGLTCHGPVS